MTMRQLHRAPGGITVCMTMAFAVEPHRTFIQENNLCFANLPWR